MRSLALAMLVCATSGGAVLARGWEERDGGWVASLEGGEVAFRAPGVLEVGLPDGPPIRVSLFQWHDAWVYERLEGGEPDRPAHLDARGLLVQEGLWAASDAAPPLRYWLSLDADGPSVTVRLRYAKTGAMRLTNGVWCNLDYSAVPREGRTAYLRPSAHAPLGQALAADCDAVLIGLEGNQAACFEAEGFTEARNQGWPAIEMRLRPGDIAEDETGEASLRISFDRIPERFPGEVLPSREPLALGGLRPVTSEVAIHALLELEVDLAASWDNPFDPDDVALDAEVRTASGREYRLPGFYEIPCRRVERGGGEMWVPEGEGRWLVRLAATEVGPLDVRLTARDRSGSVTSEWVRHTVVPGPGRGFLRASEVDLRYLAYETGVPFLPIGHNLPIYHSSGQTGEQAIRKMAAAGENFNRWWMSNAGLGIEWGGKAGWYRQSSAATLDRMLAVAAELGFVYMLCFDTHQDFLEGAWPGHPYQTANGGPCETVEDWFASPEARELYRKRLRYIVARWAWSPHVLCWELGNEFEGWPASQEAKIDWHAEMARTLTDLDPYDHPITTSWWSQTGPPECWAIPDLGIVQTHCYTNNDANVAEQVRLYCLRQWDAWAKPHIFGEFGIRSHTTTADKDPEGWALHNANWAAVASGACGIPMPWWHEDYIDPLDLYFHFGAIARFVAGLPFGTARWEQLVPSDVTYVEPPDPPLVRDVVLTPRSVWGKALASDLMVARDGTLEPPDALQELLHGKGHPELRNPPRFAVEFPAEGHFSLTVGRVSSSGRLTIALDGEPVLDREFPCGDGLGRESVYRSEWDLWETTYDEEVTIEVPAGRHTIAVDNLGEDWMRIGRYVFTGCARIERPDLLVAAIRCPEIAILWAQNRASDWCNRGRGEVPPVPASRIALAGFGDGEYEVEWWSTWRGEIVRTERVNAAGGSLVLLPGEIDSDVAARIRKAR